jgi:hypothetical protein
MHADRAQRSHTIFFSRWFSSHKIVKFHWCMLPAVGGARPALGADPHYAATTFFRRWRGWTAQRLFGWALSLVQPDMLAGFIHRLDFPFDQRE